MRNKTILIITTDATRTGTPLLLIRYLNWIKENSNLNFIFLLRNGGALINDFKKLGKVHLWGESESSFRSNWLVTIVLKIANKIFKIHFSTLIFLLKIKTSSEIDLIFSNSARNGEILPLVTRIFDRKIITYVHEGEKILDLFNMTGAVTYNLSKSDSIIAVTNFVKNMLLKKYELKQKIDVISGSIQQNITLATSKFDLRQKYFIPKESIVIMSCGWLGWHKGTDYFVQLARNIILKNNNVVFVWVGGSETDEVYKQIMFDANKFDLVGKIILIPSVTDNLEHLNMADIFLMLSREESFSLVTLEACTLMKPTLCFEQSGGPCEILNFNSELLVPYGDIKEMERRINTFIESEDLRNNVGNDLYKFVSENYNFEANARKLCAIIQDKIQNV